MSIPNMTSTIQLIRSKAVLHRADTRGIVITRTDYIQTPDGIIAVDFWSQWETGRLVRVAAPRQLHAGETV